MPPAPRVSPDFLNRAPRSAALALNSAHRRAAPIDVTEVAKRSMEISVVSTSERPDLVPVVARWLWDEWRRRDGHSFEQTLEAVHESVTARHMPRTFILLADGQPVGTASLAAHDLDDRPDLSPWLADVFVLPAARGRGHAVRLVAAAEAECRAASIPTLWLYTGAAERFYARNGWRTVETIQRVGGRYALMRRELFGRASPPSEPA